MDQSAEFISESVVPDSGTFDTAAMATGQAGLPTGFTWRNRHYQIVGVESQWKASESWNHAAGERYYRRHYWRVRVHSGQTFTLYTVRKTKSGESARKRWWLYSIDSAPASDGRP